MILQPMTSETVHLILNVVRIFAYLAVGAAFGYVVAKMRKNRK